MTGTTGHMKPSGAPVDAVLLIGFGGPESAEEVMPFLRKVVEGRGVPDERLQAVAQHYIGCGGRSPYNDLTRQQGRALEQWLRRQDCALPVHVGMRNWHPWLHESVGRIVRDGGRHVVGIILAAHRSPVSWERYKQDMDAARAAADADSLAVSYLEPWFDAPGFIEANAARLEEATGHVRGAWPAEVPVIFTAHSIPLAMAEHSPYVADVEVSCRAVAALLGLPDWETAYQSRSGDPRRPWLEPDVGQVVERRARDGSREIAVQAIGFLCDHLEVIHDLDIELRQTADACGVRLHRAGCVNDHPAFIEMLGESVLSLVRGAT